MQGLLRNPQWLFFFTQIAIWIHQAHCSYLPDHLEAQQYAAQKSFPLFERPIGFETEVLRECGVSKYYRRRRPRENQVTSRKPTEITHFLFKEEDNVQKTERQKARIINGKQSRPGAWPWQVSLQLLHPKLGFVGHWCGGVLLNGLKDDYWILTAAHCISNDAFNYPFGPLWTAVLGEHDRSVEEGYEQRMLVEKIYLHERFKEYHHDIALLKLQGMLNSSNTGNRVKAICLPSEDDEIFDGVRCIATGWGQSKKGNKLENILHQTELPVIENAHCKQVYGTMYNIPINSYHLCAGPLTDGASGTCVGDSGGPLQCSMRDGRWYLAGITSFGSGCAKPGFPDVFTRITYYLPWIRGKFRSI